MVQLSAVKLELNKGANKMAADPETTGKSSLSKAREAYNREKRARGGKSTKRFKKAEKAYIKELESSIGSLKAKQSPPMPSRPMDTPSRPSSPRMPDNRKILRQKRLAPDGEPGFLTMKKGGAVHTMPDGTIMKGAKHGMEAGGYVLNTDEKRRRKEFKGAPAVKKREKIEKIEAAGETKMKHGGMVIVDRQYLKGKQYVKEV